MPKRTHPHGVKKRCTCRDPNCSHGYHFGFHFDGREHRVSLDRVSRQRDIAPPRTRRAAVALADTLRHEIRAGTWPPKAEAAAAVTTWTVGAVADRYLIDHVRTPGRRKRARALMELHLDQIRAAEITLDAAAAPVRLGDVPIAELTPAHVELFRQQRRAQQARTGRTFAKGGEAGINRTLARFRALCRWAIAHGYCDGTPFARHNVAVVKLNAKAEAPRTRRLRAGEERALLGAADDRLRAFLVAMLSTGCRPGELLSLTWGDVQTNAKGEPSAIVVRADVSKNDAAGARAIPIGGRLRAELAMRRCDPAGAELPASALVFGNAIGEPCGIRRSWEDAVLRASGHQPIRKRGKLTAASRAAFAAVGLHLHDLRRESASRVIESGLSMADAAALLGHTSVVQTATYLRSTPMRLAKAIDALDAAVSTPATNDAEAVTAAASAPDRSFAHGSHKQGIGRIGADADAPATHHANMLQ